MACRTPHPLALDAIRRGVERVVEVTDEEIEDAMRAIYDDMHNVAEGAAASGLAALLQEREKVRGRDVAIVLTGANVDAEIFARVLQEYHIPRNVIALQVDLIRKEHYGTLRGLHLQGKQLDELSQYLIGATTDIFSVTESSPLAGQITSRSA